MGVHILSNIEIKNSKTFCVYKNKKYKMSYHQAIQEICQMCNNPYYDPFDEVCVCHSESEEESQSESEVEFENCCMCGEPCENLVENCMCFECDRDLTTVEKHHHLLGCLEENDPLRFQILKAKSRLKTFTYGKTLMSWYP